MVRALEAARNAARRAQEAAYEGFCMIVEYHDKKDEKTKLFREEEVIVVKDQPCKLSFEKLTAATQTETVAVMTQGIKLFLAPEIKVNPGAKLIVTQNEVTEAYCASGKPAIYPTHQEIMLELVRRWA